MVLAEEFVLLALDADGRPAHGLSNQPAAAVGVTGALVTELVQEGHVDVADGRIRLTGTRPTKQAPGRGPGQLPVGRRVPLHLSGAIGKMSVGLRDYRGG